jgi:hypothetical protein
VRIERSDWEHVKAALIAKGALKSRRCPCCEQEDWLVTEPLQFAVAASGPTIALVCKNCGYVRLHDRTILRE